MMPADMPIIKFYCPPNADLETREGMESVAAQLEASSEKKLELTGVLRKYGAKAVIIAPDFNESRREDTGSDYLFCVLPDPSSVKPMRLSALSLDAEKILGVKGNAYSFERQGEPWIARGFRIEKEHEDPVHQVFQELDGRGVGLANA